MLTQKVSLLGPPVVEDGYAEKYVAEEDDVVKLNCPIIGNPKPIIEWYRDDQLIPIWDRFRTNRKTLKIKGVTLADSGIIECKGVNGFGSESVQIHLLVKNRKDGLMKSNKIETLLNEVHSQILVPKETQRSTPSSGIAPQIIHTTSVHGEAIHKRTGDTLRLECQVDGIPPPSIVWYKVSHDLHFKSHFISPSLAFAEKLLRVFTFYTNFYLISSLQAIQI